MMGRDEPTADSGAETRTVRIELSLCSVFSIIAIGISFWLLVRVWEIILVLTIALVLAGTLSPAVDWLEEQRIRRVLALTLVLLAMILTVVGLGFLVLPALVGQIGALIEQAPDLQNRLADYLARISPLAGPTDTIREAQPDRYLEPIGAYALTFAQAAVELVAYGVTAVVLAFYLIADRASSALPRPPRLRGEAVPTPTRWCRAAWR